MRLIDADAVKQNILEVIKKQGGKSKDLIPVMELPLFIDIQQTAYSVDKVVEELDKASYLVPPKNKGYYADNAINLEDAIEIVKQGGVTNDVCEWKMDNVGASIGCRSDLHHTGYVNRTYCPYCGKKIKVVE